MGVTQGREGGGRMKYFSVMDFEAVPKSKASVHEFETTRKEGSKHVEQLPSSPCPILVCKSLATRAEGPRNC